MALVRWDPARELDLFQSDMNRLIDTVFQGRGVSTLGNGTQRWVPPMDLVETGEEFVLRADLPGLDRDDVDIEVKDNVLTITGERESEHEARDEGYHRVERSFGRFSRSLELPEGIETGAISADFDHGVLEVRIPKPEERQPTRVQIRAGSRKKVSDGGD